jgi:division protein CdvB (Snf7/Vps24/ESCRT-III family)
MKISRSRLKEIVKEVMVEETEYQQFFQNALDKAGKSIPEMSEEEKKAFFDKVDAAWQGKGEKNEAKKKKW